MHGVVTQLDALPPDDTGVAGLVGMTLLRKVTAR